MPRPKKVFTEEEKQGIVEAWSLTHSVSGACREYQRIMEIESPPTWDTMRRWLDVLGLREDPTGRNEKLAQRSQVTE